MTDAEKAENFSDVVSECLKTSDEALTEINKFKVFVKDAMFKTKGGIGFFDTKNREMLAYLADLSHLMSNMSMGKSIQNDPAIARLMKRRVVLEKMRPTEAKLRPQVERLLGAKSAKTRNQETMRARPEQFVISDNEGEDDDEEEEGEKEKQKKYVPPKIRAMQYDGDEQEREARRLNRAKQRALQSSLIRDLRSQYGDAPEEVFDEVREKESRADIERRQYEEANFVRLQMSKKEKAQEQRRQRMDDLDKLLHFGDYMAEDKHKAGYKRKHPGPIRKGGRKFKKGSGGGRKKASGGPKRKSKKKK